MVLGLCRLLLRDGVEAEDAAQQVFVSAQRALLGGAVAREPAAWLVAIARNECRARIGARMREPLALPEVPADIPDPLAAAIGDADLDALWAALSELPRRQRKAFLLRELGGLSYSELGAALGVTRPAVESLLYRARRQLRNLLAAANAAFVPVAVREQLLASGSGPSFGAKLAAVTVGVGLGAASVVELPKDHQHHVRAAAPSAAPVPVVAPAHRARPLRAVEVSEPVVVRHVDVRERRGDRAAARDRRDGPAPAEAEHGTEVDPPEAEVEAPQQVQSVPEPPLDQGAPSGDVSSISHDGAGGSHDAGAPDGGGSDHGSDSVDGG
jgi:RNA polymerase sigma-70 factor (ECF subfamily)